MLNLIEPMNEIKRRRSSFESEAKHKFEAFDEAYRILEDMNEACFHCNGQGKRLRSRSCAEDDAPDPNDPRDWLVCTWCGGSGRKRGKREEKE